MTGSSSVNAPVSTAEQTPASSSVGPHDEPSGPPPLESEPRSPSPSASGPTQPNTGMSASKEMLIGSGYPRPCEPASLGGAAPMHHAPSHTWLHTSFSGSSDG